MLVECRGLTRTFGKGRAEHVALAGVCLAFHRGEACALIGPSGSGKTTLLSILGFLLSPSSGELLLDGSTVDFRAKGRLAGLRRRYIGFVFQHAQLLPFLSIAENLRVVARNAGLGRRESGRRIAELLDTLGITELRQKSPQAASGGERQRVAIARALLHSPPIILADEPTASLDSANGQNVVRMLVDQARHHKALLIVVTHDTRIVDEFDRVLHIDSGRIVET